VEALAKLADGASAIAARAAAPGGPGGGDAGRSRQEVRALQQAVAALERRGGERRAPAGDGPAGLAAELEAVRSELFACRQEIEEFRSDNSMLCAEVEQGRNALQEGLTRQAWLRWELERNRVAADIADLAETAPDSVADGLGLEEDQSQQACRTIRVEKCSLRAERYDEDPGQSTGQEAAGPEPVGPVPRPGLAEVPPQVGPGRTHSACNGASPPPPSSLRASEDAESGSSTELGSDDSGSEYSDDGCDSNLPATFSVEDTILIFDWDDTVLPSTWIQEQGLCLDEDSVATEEQEAQLQIMAGYAMQTLRVAKRHGKVVLVTNAESGWIELSCQKFMPSLYPSLENVKILSARSCYEQQGVTSPFEWKYLAFESEINSFYDLFGDHQRKNIISFGDSAHEREALIRVTESIPACRTKSLKFVERPEVEQLLKEHKLISGCFRHIVNHDGNLDLCIRCS